MDNHLIRPVRFPTPEDLEAARNVVQAHLPATPLVDARIGDGEGFLKLETLQPTGSFKVRGALAAVSQVAPGGRVMAVSAGNHALGIAHASGVLGVPATVVLAKTASPAKLSALRRFPIEVITHGATYDEAEEYALHMAAEAGRDATFISAYNDPHVIVGQSTTLDEIVAAVPDRPLTVIVPTGGGGFLAGICLRAIELSSAGRQIRVVGVEAAASTATSAAVAAGHVVPVTVGDTIADGVSGNIEPGSVTVDIIARCAPGLVSVTEDEISNAIRFLAANQGIVAEGAGAVATAALLAGKVQKLEGSVPVAIVSGRNIALPRLAAILAG